MSRSRRPGAAPPGPASLVRGRRDAARFALFPAADRAQAFLTLDLAAAALARRPGHAAALACAAERLTALGHYEAGLALDERLARSRPRDPSVRYNLACSLALARPAEPERALGELSRAVALGWRDAALLRRDPDLAALRGHPDFEPLARKAEKGGA